VFLKEIIWLTVYMVNSLFFYIYQTWAKNVVDNEQLNTNLRIDLIYVYMCNVKPKDGIVVN